MNARLWIAAGALALIGANSAPEPTPLPPPIPAARDLPYPGTMTLKVDVSDLDRAIMRVEQTIPVAQAGPMVLLAPAWLPGTHAPRGAIEKLAGLTLSADGKPLAWKRDLVDVRAFHVTIPQGARTLVARFQYMSATATDQGRIEMTPNLISLQWEDVSLYPAGWFTRQIPVQASVTWPVGWKAAGALAATGTAGHTVTYERTTYETLIDSPMVGGRYSRFEALAPGITLALFADRPQALAAKPEQIAAHRRLIEQADLLFGARHFDRYVFLLALSDQLGDIGLEHHRSSENGVEPGYFTDWDAGPGERNLLPHEYVHSWNGKFRRPADLWTPDYSVPMRDDLLWVYEGQTQFWGYVLGARSGLYSKQQTLDALAFIAAQLDTRRGRVWRSLEDTTLDPIIAARRPKAWPSWQRAEDYYNEGLLVWLEIDAMLRKGTGGQRGMDDFARAFFGMRPGDWGVYTYQFGDIAATLNTIMPYDWAGHLNRRLSEKVDHAPLEGLTLGGYALVYTDKPSSATEARMKMSKSLDLAYSLGLLLKGDGVVDGVLWDSPAFNAGLAVGQQILAVNGQTYSETTIKDAITDAATSKQPLSLIVRGGQRVRTVTLNWTGGLRYPHLRKTGVGESSLDRLLAAR